MQFVVPQFIERKAKIVGPLDFKQFAFIGITGAICIFLFFTLSAISVNIRIAMCVLILGIGGALAFVKIGKDPLPVVIKNFFFFFIGPKIYLWKKKPFNDPIFAAPKKTAAYIAKEEEEKKQAEEQSSLRITQKSQLKKLATHIETKMR